MYLILTTNFNFFFAVGIRSQDEHLEAASQIRLWSQTCILVNVENKAYTYNILFLNPGLNNFTS